MKKITAIPSTQNDLPIKLRSLRVATYCRVSTEQEEQTGSIELQELYYTQLIADRVLRLGSSGE